MHKPNHKQRETNLTPAGYTLFLGNENFIQDLSEQEESMISGGSRRSRRRRRTPQTPPILE